MATLIIAGKSYDIADGTRLTNAIEAEGIDILHRCGGFARCTTCKVTFNSGEPADLNSNEATKLDEKGDKGEYRLSCQILSVGEMDINVLMTMTSTGLDDAGPELSPEIPE